MSDFEGPLVEAAQRYLKEHYGEDTVSMTVTHNGVEGGNGVLSVEEAVLNSLCRAEIVVGRDGSTR